MPQGSTWRFKGATDPTPNLDDAKVNSLDAGGNVYESPNGGLNVRISGATLWAWNRGADAYAGEATDYAVAPSSTVYIFAEPDTTTGAWRTGSNTTGWPTTRHVPLAVVSTGGATVAGIADARPRIAGQTWGAPPSPVYRSGGYYGQELASASTQAVLAAGVDTLVALPWAAGRALGIDRIAIDIQAAGGAGELARLGLYGEDPATPGYPGPLLEDLGTVLIDAIGAKALVVAPTRRLERGRVFPCLVTDSATALIRSYPNAVGAPLGLDPTDLSIGLHTYVGALGVQAVAAALPASFPLGATVSGPAAVPCLAFRVA